MGLRQFIYPARMLTHESSFPKNSIFTIVCSRFCTFRQCSDSFSPSSSVLQCDWYVFIYFVGSWFSCNSTCFVCTQLLSIFFEAKGNFEYLAVFLPIPHIALYNHIQSTGGRCWYVSRVLSQGYPTFPFDKPLFLGLDINKAHGAETR